MSCVFFFCWSLKYTIPLQSEEKPQKYLCKSWIQCSSAGSQTSNCLLIGPHSSENDVFWDCDCKLDVTGMHTVTPVGSLEVLWRRAAARIQLISLVSLWLRHVGFNICDSVMFKQTWHSFQVTSCHHCKHAVPRSHSHYMLQHTTWNWDLAGRAVKYNLTTA